MFVTLFVVLVVLWLLGWFTFQAAGGLIHVLLVVAVIFSSPSSSWLSTS